MHAAVVESFEAPPRYSTFADPVPEADELLIDVRAAGLHQLVRGLAAGKHYGSAGKLPFVPGVDGVGVASDGRRVYFLAGRSPFGSMAERSVAARAACLPVPDTLDDVTVAAMMNPAMSSWAALAERAHFARGESVLILGATGTSGQLAVQIARRFGAHRIVGAGRNREALDEAKTLGADAVIPLTDDRDALVAAFRDAIAEHKIDVVLDYLWGAPAETLLAAIAQKGLAHAAPRIRYIQIGSSAGPAISLPGATLRSSGLELLGSGFGSVSMEGIFRTLTAVLHEAARAPFQFHVAPAPLSQVESAWNARNTEGRLVFQP